MCFANNLYRVFEKMNSTNQVFSERHTNTLGKEPYFPSAKKLHSANTLLMQPALGWSHGTPCLLSVIKKTLGVHLVCGCFLKHPAKIIFYQVLDKLHSAKQGALSKF